MTIFEAVQLGVGQSRESLTDLFDYGHTTYGQMSLTTVNDKNLWTKKLSLTESDLSGYIAESYLARK